MPKRWDTEQNASWIDLRGSLSVQLILHLAAKSARVSAGDAVVLGYQIDTEGTSNLFRAIITFQDSDFILWEGQMTAWKAQDSVIRSVVHLAQYPFSNSGRRRCYLWSMQAIVIASSTYSPGIHGYCTKDVGENSPPYSLQHPSRD